MRYIRILYTGFVLCLFADSVLAQRTYAPQSVLATGNWYQIAVTEAGVYKMDINFLNRLGISTSNIPIAAIRLFGNGADMLPEENSVIPPDDLVENAITVVDDGDGIFNRNDYVLFYASGTTCWKKDSLAQRFVHQKNLYTDTSYFYLTIGGSGKRVQTTFSTQQPTQIVNSYNARYYYENDLVNWLHSGKEWYGEKFSNLPGGASGYQFSIDWKGLITSHPITFISTLAARSIGSAATFNSAINSVPIQSITIPPVSGSILDFAAVGAKEVSSIFSNQSVLNVNITFQSAASGAEGRLDWFELHGRRKLSFEENAPLYFRDWLSVGAGSVAAFVIDGIIGNTTVWDITRPLAPEQMSATTNAGALRFTNDASYLREYIAFNINQVKVPVVVGKIENQNLHAADFVDYLIITQKELLPEANRLAAFHRSQQSLTTSVVDVDKIYHEFSGGIKDPAAIRNYVKMFYDKAGSDTARRSKYLLLFGSASYDYKNRVVDNSNSVPTYQSAASLDPLSSFASDDFFGLLDDTDNINNLQTGGTLDIAIGRIPAHNLQEAATMVDKIIGYTEPAALGNWRNQMILVADDQDIGLHVKDAEILSGTIQTQNPNIQIQKVYLDAYPLESGAGGARYPTVNEALVSKLNVGALILNYSGHGSHVRLSEESVFTSAEVKKMRNANRLPLFITASCDFYPYDDPTKKSLGQEVLTQDTNGAIALLTTARLVFASSNRVINDNFLKNAFQKDALGNLVSLGRSVQLAKNISVQSPENLLNTRKFILLGDPAMHLALPKWAIGLDSMNEQPIVKDDTLSGLVEYVLSGKIKNEFGADIKEFNGTMQTVIYDRLSMLQTLGNQAYSPKLAYQSRNNKLFQGTVTVTDGRFRVKFRLPKAVGAGVGRIQMSFYASNDQQDAVGIDTNFFINGNAVNLGQDDTGPDIALFLNDTAFKEGGLTHEFPILLAKIYDTSGIQASGTGIGHDITLVLDGAYQDIRVLNDYFQNELDSYRKGTIRYSLPELKPGKHTLTVKVWDLANNANEKTLHFTVASQEKLAIDNLRNYPNPAVAGTRFSFEHNQPDTPLSVTIQIYTQSGQLVRRLHEEVLTKGTRSFTISWDGNDEKGHSLQKGLYIYRVIIEAGQERYIASRQLFLF